ncbi:MAG TPA: BTAD domain-containing putative transcriptional regulator [Acidimicrobiales bacterium]|nr:BTAD domain-containing putative transcriptional regulator [Acidimicrobiales bacterium]
MYDDRPVEVGRPKQRAVLATLLIHGNEVVSVDRFADVLWQDGGVSRSTGSLAVYIANLRRLIEPDRPARTPPERILTRAPGYLLRVGPGEYDAADFERLAAEGHRHLADGRPQCARRTLTEAVALWRGRAMEEFAFAEMEAGRLEGLRLAATKDRLVADLALGAHGAVVVELEHLVRAEPLNERLVELLMLALYRSGRQGDALRAYMSARGRLREELGIEPGPDLRRLESDILAQDPALDWQPPRPEGVVPPAVAARPVQTSVRHEVFVGRVAELAALDGALADGRNSRPIALLAGEPGIGKTRLAREAAERAATRGCVVAWGRCEEGDGAPPFWPWLQALRALLAHPDTGAVRAALGPDAAEISRLVPEVRELVEDLPPPAPLDPTAARHRFFEAVAGFLARLSQHQPVAVILDDLHWADRPSLELTGHVARRLSGSNSCLVVTYRDVDPAPSAALAEVLASVARQPGRVHLALQGLTRDEVAEFVAHEAGEEAVAEILAAVWDRAGGNPFFVGELTRLLVTERARTGRTPTAAGVPWAVRQVVGRRMARLPEATQELLVVAAVTGNDFDLRAVAGAAGVDLDRALDLIDVSIAAGLVSERSDAVERFQFSHALVQEAIYEDLTQLRRARLHGLVADALEQVGGDQARATEVAHHRYEAVPVCGPVLAVLAAGRAAAAAEAALAHDVAEDHLRRGLALAATMAAGPERDRHELDLQVRLATLLSVAKGLATPESAGAWARATELCQAVEDRRGLLRSLWGMFTFAWARGDMEGSRVLADHMLQLRRTSADPAVTVTAHLALGLVAVCVGDVVDGAAHLAAGKEVADAAEEEVLAGGTFTDLRVQVDSWLSMARHLQGDHQEGRRLVDAALERGRALGSPFGIATALSFALFDRVLVGEVADARRLAGELIDQADRLQLTDFTYHGRVVRAWAMAHGRAPESDVLPLLDALPSALTAGIRPWHPFWLALTAETWQRLGRLDEARRLVGEAQAEAEAMGSSFSLPEVLRLRGELDAALQPERCGEALADLRQAARQAEAQGATVLRDRALASAERLTGTGSPSPTRHAEGAWAGTRRRPGPEHTNPEVHVPPDPSSVPSP